MNVEKQEIEEQSYGKRHYEQINNAEDAARVFIKMATKGDVSMVGFRMENVQVGDRVYNLEVKQCLMTKTDSKDESQRLKTS